MSAQLVENIQYFDSDGLPLVDGLIYIGTNLLEPIGNLVSIFSDEALTVSITNPQTIDTDGFSENKIYIDGKYSLRVNTVLGVQFLLDLDVGKLAVSEFKELVSVSGSNSITASTGDTITAYTDKQIFVLNAAGTNTTTGVTLNVDSVGAKSIVKDFDQALDPGDITANQPLVVVYNLVNDNFHWINASVKTKRQRKGSDIASASSITVPDNDGNYFDITGAVTIATINGVAETFYTFQMDSTATFTNSASLIMIGATSFTAAAGDVLEFYQLTSTTVINTNIAKADGTSVTTSSPLTTKGDTYGNDGTDDIRIAVGSNGQVMTADSTATGGKDWATLSISQGNLNTSTGEVSFTSGSTTQVTSLVTLPGGQFGFFPQIKHTVVASSTGGWTGPDDAIIVSTFLTKILLTIDGNGDSSSKTTTGIQRFISASPPYILFGVEVASFIFARVQKGLGNIKNMYHAPDPPWAHNGPTDISPEIIKNNKKFRTIRRLKEGASLEDNFPFESQLIEITSAYKNSDMDLIPHPFQGNDLSNDNVILIDPASKLVENLEIMKNSGESALDLFHNDYIRIDNTELEMSGPEGVNIFSAKMTNKLRV